MPVVLLIHVEAAELVYAVWGAAGVNINLVTDGQHVLGRIASSLGNALRDIGYDVTEGPHAYRSKANVYLPYYFFQPPVKTRKDVCLFTHLENANDPMAQKKTELFLSAARRCDLAWCMSSRTHDDVLRAGSEAAIIAEIPADPQFQREEIVFGICGIAQPFNRKGFDLLKEIEAVPGAEVLLTDGKYKWQDMPAFYRGIDYLIVTGKVEGGPMPVKEAIGMGKPVIAPDVGWCWEYPVIQYENKQHLLDIVWDLAPTRRDEWADLARDLLSGLG